MKRNVRLERVYPHPIERVFATLTDPVALADWLMPNDFEPRLGHEFTFRSKPQGNWNGITQCKVIALEPPRRLAFTWSGDRKDGKGKALANTVVTFTLREEGDGTRLVLEHTGFDGFGELLTSLILQAGWKKMMGGKLADWIGRTRA